MKHIMSLDSTSKLTNVQEGDVQPNAVDLRIGKVFRIQNNVFELSESSKVHRGSVELFPNEDGWWFLEQDNSYEVVMENDISVGIDEAGWVITRSTLIRNGCFLTSGLYDSGYAGVMAGCLHVRQGPLLIQRGTRIGQYLSFKAEALHAYEGSYGFTSTHDQKYT
jgi:deoxycytidine triphosphate deaminase